MDGLEMKYRVQLLLDEETGADFLDEKTVYDFLNEGALEVARQSNALTTTQSITTVADQTGYTLNANFLHMYLRDRGGDFFIKYNDGTSNTFIKWAPYEDIITNDDTTSILIPSRFSITDDPTLDSQITGTETSGGAVDANSGEVTLTDSAADFSDVSAGDIVHNTTDSSSGVVVSKTSSTVLVTALFPDDPSATVDKDWDSSDAYVIQPQGRFRLVLDPPPSTAGHTITFYYVHKPAPVWSAFKTFRYSQHLNLATVKYAAWLLKYRDREPDFGDKLFVMADNTMRKNKHGVDKALNRNRIRVNMKVRN
tara:strand:+ start:18979 stop:19908 length:930 start_codon:yes stop_codon:yes gene_type:complete